MANGTSPSLRLPGEATRELWLREGTGAWKRADKDDGEKGGIFGVEALALDFSPFWAQSAGQDAAGIASTTALRWEALGLETETGGCSWMCWQIAEEEGRILTGTVALAAEAPQEEWADFRPDSFEVAARLFPIPAGELAVWKELGRYVVAFARGEQLLHVSVLSARELDASAASELRHLWMSLEVSGMASKLRGIRIWTAGSSKEFAGCLKRYFDVRVRMEDKPAPVLPDQPSRLLPPLIAEMRVEGVRRARRAQFLAIATAVYVGFFAVWATWLFWRDHKINKAVAELNARQPAVEAVRDAQQRWTALEAATDPNTYPVEVFHQVAALLPDEGIRLKEFSLDLEKLTVSGEASSVNHALKFIADIKASPALERFSMQFPQPTLMDDNRASFRGEGLTQEGGHDEG